MDDYRYSPNYLEHLNKEENTLCERLNEDNSGVFEEHMERIREGNFGPLEIVEREKCGVGVISHEHLVKGSLICRYMGEILTEEYMSKNKEIDGDDMFSLIASKDPHTSLVVNPCKFTNIARYINGVKQLGKVTNPLANILSFRVSIKGKIYVILYTSRNIPAHEELPYQYNGNPIIKGRPPKYPHHHFI